MVLGTLGPLDLGTLGPFDSSTSSLLLPLASSYLLLSLPPSLLLWSGLVWRWTFDLYIDVKKLRDGGWWCTLDYNVN